MFKMSTCGVGLLLAGLVGLACGGQPGLNGAGGSTSGSQDGHVCPAVPCPSGLCSGGYQPSTEPCGCHSCSATPDAGLVKDAGSPDGPICQPGLLPCVPGPTTCPAGYQVSSDPTLCGCGGCVPVDGGMAVDGSTTDVGLSCSLSASQYDNSCTVDSDCVGVPPGDPCAGNCLSVCPTAALNVRVASQYLADLGAVMSAHNESPGVCSCPAFGTPSCCRGVCSVEGCSTVPDAGVAKDAQDAGPRTPLLHRSAGVTCPTGRGPGLSICDCTGSDGPCSCAPGECGQDSNCTAGISGRCLMNGPAPTTACSYDTCFSDSDCPAKTPCVCRDSASSSAPNSCLTGSDCRVDSDCGPGNFCSPSQYGQWCGFTYHCHTASDTCVDDSDCVGAGCNFNMQTGHWACGGDCGPAPP